MDSPKVVKLLDAVTTTGAGPVQAVERGTKGIHARVSGSGTVSATVEIYGSNESRQVGGALRGTITLAGTDNAGDGFQDPGSFLFYYATVTAISGTGAAVTASVGV